MAGTVVQTNPANGTGVRVITFACTGDSSDGSIPATAIEKKFNGRLLALETNPGATAPTSNYDITLVDSEGHDVLQGVGGDRHTSNTEKALIVYSSTSVHPCVVESDTLTLTFANNAVNSAVITVKLYIEVTD